ncbi:MAG TPA: SAF domain-containing protein, partial [Rhizomicrobium sp.]
MTRKALIFVLFALLPLPALAAATQDAGVRVVVPAHDIPRGQAISESDLTYATVAGNALMAG